MENESSFREEAVSLARAVAEHVKHPMFNKNVEVVLAPPFIFLYKVYETLYGGKVKLAGQDVFWEKAGAYTGEVSPAQLKNLGAAYVIVGHSERRALGETDEIVGRKLTAVLEAGMTPILCVGEPADVRERGMEAAKEFVGKQLEVIEHKVFEGIIAYEPVWAIGTGNNATPGDAAEMITLIKSLVTSYRLPIPVLYGGSVTSGNAGDFLNREEIDGLLVGGGSLNAEEFGEICRGA